MAELTKKEMLEIVQENIEKIKSKNFNVFFYVIDTKGNPSGSLEYIYQTAYELQELGYNVTMLQNEKDEFVGVEEWLGSKYANLPHKNIETENVEISASDFLFIPEIFAGTVMAQTKNLPCKRIMILQNYNFLAEFMPISATFDDLRISDCITTTYAQKQKLNEYFPKLNVDVVEPSIKSVFRNCDEPRKLIVNVISKNQEDIYRVMKPFYWKYPVYKWISFRELRGMDQETLSTALREAAITIWIDEDSNFGYTALEAMRCGSLLLAKVPKTLSDWNIETDDKGNKKLTDACIWFDHIDAVPDMLASVVRSWTIDKVPDEVYQNLHKLDNRYTVDVQKNEIKDIYVNKIFERRLKDFEEVEAQIKNNPKEK